MSSQVWMGSQLCDLSSPLNEWPLRNKRIKGMTACHCWLLRSLSFLPCCMP
ncbi:hypothetical protein V6Z11_D01G129500 [Gossypium hirsutum]